MRFHLLAPEEKDAASDAMVQPRQKKYEYKVVVFAGNKPGTCQYFDPKGNKTGTPNIIPCES